MDNIKHYPRRSGTDDAGRDYEAKMSALFVLRCAMSKDTQNMWMGSNVQHLGDFDDIVLLRQTTKGRHDAFLIQLKHQVDPKSITQRDLTCTHVKNKHQTKDFSLAKYSVSFEELKKKLANPEDEFGVIEYLSKADRIKFVLFSNKGVTDCDFLKSAQDDVLDFLNTSKSDRDVYGFRKEKLDYDPDFLEQFLLFTNQAHVNDMDKLLKKEVKKLMGSFKLGRVNFEIVAGQFLEFIRAWIKVEHEGIKRKGSKIHHALAKSDVIGKLTSILLEPYELNFSKHDYSFYDCPQKKLWNKIINDKVITVVDSNNEVLDFLKQYIGSEIGRYCRESGKTWCDGLSNKAQNSFYDLNQNLRTLLITIPPSDYLTKYNIYQCLWFNGKLPKLLQAHHLQDYHDILRIIKITDYKFHVLIIKKDTIDLPAKKKTFASLDDIKEEYINQLLNQSVRLQGRPSLKLRSFIDRSMYQHVKCRDIIEIVSGTFSIGYQYEPLFKYFVNRRLSRVFLDPKVVNEVNEYFVVQDGNFKNNPNVITPDEVEALKNRSTIHQVTHYSDNRLEWRKSLGGTENIRRYLLQGCADDFWVDLNDDIYGGQVTHVISAVPGMGKSMLVDFMSLNAPGNVWVLKVVLNQYEDHYDSMKEKDETFNAVDHLEYFNNTLMKTKMCTNATLAHAVFQKLMKAKQVVVLLDGFDEIAISHKKEVAALAKSLRHENYTTYITTRQVMQQYLEDIFETISLTLEPFTYADQSKFLIDYFTDLTSSPKTLITEKFVEALLQAARRNLNDKDSKFTGIPLQTQLLGEVFSDDYKNSVEKGTVVFKDGFDLLYLYQKCIDRKIDILCSKFGKDAARTRSRYEKHQKLFALKILFDQKYHEEMNINRKLEEYEDEDETERRLVQRDGIVILAPTQELNINFVHRTYSEYLAAQWLSENYDNKDAKLRRIVDIFIIKARFGVDYNNYSFLFKIFDGLLAQSCPLHKAIINERVEEVELGIKENPNYLDTVDKGGRSLLHLLALNGANHLDYPDHNLNSVEGDKMALIIQHVPSHKITNAKDKMSYSPLDYAVMGYRLAVANSLCEKSKLDINIDVGKYDTYEGVERMRYCAPLGYKPLFMTLLPYFVRRDLLKNIVQKDISIETYRKIRLGRSWTIGDYHQLFNVANISELLQPKDLYLAATVGVDDVSQLLSMGAEVNKQDICNNTPLHYAVIHKRLEIVKFLLSKGALVNQQGNGGNSPLHNAAELGFTEIVAELVACHADIDEENDAQDTPLLLALRNDHVQTAALLVFKTNNINKADKNGNTPLHYAASVNNEEIARNLLLKGADVNKQNKVGDTPLLIAFNFGYYAVCVRPILSYNPDCSLANNKGDFPLLRACEVGQTDIVSDLLQKGSNVNRKNKRGETPLKSACKYSHVATVQLLLSKGAEYDDEPFFLHFAAENGWDDTVIDLISKNVNINVQNHYGETPLMLSLKSGNRSISKLFLSHGADVRLTCDSGNSCLHYAVRVGDNDLVRDLLDLGASIDKQNDKGHSPLFEAVQYKQFRTAFFLLSNGADYLLENHNGDSLLHAAAIHGDSELLQHFLSLGVNINKQNNDGETPLLVALRFDNIITACLLLSNSADIHVENKSMNTCLYFACNCDCESIVLDLISKGCDVNKRNITGDTPLWNSLHYKRANISKLLLSKGADVHTEFAGGYTVLHFAAGINDDDLISEILSKGININQQDDRGNTPLHFALRNGNAQGAKLLLLNGADNGIQNSTGNFPLHEAVAKGIFEILPLLLFRSSGSANINVRNKQGQTPLHTSVTIDVNKCFAIIEFLLTSGSYVNLQDDHGNTALYYANKRIYQVNDPEQEKLMRKVVDLLLTKGADANVKNLYGETALP